MAWDAIQIQAAWFIADPDQLSAEALFVRGVGEEPDQTTTNRQTSPTNPFLSMAMKQGPEFQRLVQVQGGRIDYLMVATEPAGRATSSAPRLRETAAKISQVASIASKISEHIDAKVFRVALVVTLQKECTSSEDASTEINKLLNNAIPFSDGLDVSFQVTRRMRSGVDDILFNRHVRTSMSIVQSVQLAAFGGGVATPVVSAESHVVERVIDINTVPPTTGSRPTKLLGIDEIKSLFSEMKNEMVRLRAADENLLRALQ